MDVPRKLALRVGGLVATAVAVGFLVILILGSQGMMFASAHTYRTAFRDVGGLREGAVVRLGGLQVGDVTEIAFAPVGDDGRESLVVTLRVKEKYADRVRKDSLARISSQGLLGDKLIELTLGSPSAPQVEDGGWVVGEPPSDPARLIATATAAAEHARSILAKFDASSEEVDLRGLVTELTATVGSVRRIAERVEGGPGTAHELIYGAELAQSATRTVRAMERAAGEGEKLISSARRSTDHLAEVTAAVDPAKVKQATDDLAGIAADVRAGRGTLGGLIADPTLYEETKRILVNIRRNRVLRSVARLVISEDMPDEIKDGSPVTVRPRPAPAAASSTETTLEAQGPSGAVRRP